jgi:hypothetical protein
MKAFSKIILTVIFVAISLVFAFSASIRFQLLSINYWKLSFESNNTYSTLVGVIQSDLVDQVTSQGGKVGDVHILTDLVTEDNLRNFIDKNLENSLNFVNGKSSEMNVYIPFNRIPKLLLPAKLVRDSEQINLQELLKEYGVAPITTSQIEKVRTISLIVNIVFLLSLCIMIIILMLLFRLVEKGKRLIAPAFTLLISGVTVFIVSGLIEIIKSNMKGGMTLAKVIIGVIAPPILSGIAKAWFFGAIVLIFFGIILFFVKKGYTKSE